MRPLVDFIIIGSGKCGSTSLYYYLSQHPDIFMAKVKEPRFFLFGELAEGDGTSNQGAFASDVAVVTSLDEYRELFRAAKPSQVRGEASIQYLSSEQAAENIGRFLPEARLMCVLRNPAERAYSNYQAHERPGQGSGRSILDILREGGPEHDYIYPGFYARHLASYAQHAPKNPINVWLCDDFVGDPQRVLREMFEFLGVNDRFEPDISVRANVTSLGRDRSPRVMLYDRVRRLSWRYRPLVQRYVSPKTRLRIIKPLAGTETSSEGLTM